MGWFALRPGRRPPQAREGGPDTHAKEAARRQPWASSTRRRGAQLLGLMRLFLFACASKPLRPLAFLVTHLQVRLRLGGKRRNGLRTPIANRAVNACCTLRIHSGRFSAFTAHRKAIGGPAVALLQPTAAQRASGTQSTGGAVPLRAVSNLRKLSWTRQAR